MSRKPRKSFVGHPAAILFSRISPEGVFQQPQAIAQVCAFDSPKSGSMSVTAMFHHPPGRERSAWLWSNYKLHRCAVREAGNLPVEIAKKRYVLVQVGNVGRIRRAALREDKGNAKPDALRAAGLQPSQTPLVPRPRKTTAVASHEWRRVHETVLPNPQSSAVFVRQHPNDESVQIRHKGISRQTHLLQPRTCDWNRAIAILLGAAQRPDYLPQTSQTCGVSLSRRMSQLLLSGDSTTLHFLFAKIWFNE